MYRKGSERTGGELKSYLGKQCAGGDYEGKEEISQTRTGGQYNERQRGALNILELHEVNARTGGSISKTT